MITRMLGISLPLLICIAACTTASVAPSDDSASVLKTAKACCESISSLPMPLPFQSDTTVLLSKDSPHFTLGAELAPFVSIAIDQASKPLSLDVMSAPMLKQNASSNDRFLRYVDTKVYFVDSNNELLPYSPSSFPLLVHHEPTRQQALSKTYVIPPNAARAILTSDPKSLGTTGSSFAGVRRDVTPVAGLFFVRAPVEVTTYFVNEVYGYLYIHINLAK